ncbi:MAG: sensor histidine kinase [Sphingobacteriales bacterium]|jgi:two-component system phosphate regulon sensor histidine kinase PhoR|nr:sensor histidine kinase [Sphingobacteriales bacterium]
MNKNPTPRSIAFFTSLLLTTLVGIASFFLFHKILLSLVFLVLVFLISYFLFLYAIEVFIYRKIKLVYKNIHSLKVRKLDPKISDINMLDPINEMEREVRDWAADKTSEIEQLRTMERYRKEFLGNVSHELKTPIFNIQGYVNTLIDGAWEDPEVLIHFLKKAAKSTDRIASLVDDLEAISQLESGFLTMELEVFDINDLIHDIFDSLDFRAKEKNIKLSIKDGCDVPFIVEADKDRIRQVIINLIVNSIKYGKVDGHTFVGLYDMDENILIEITDDGIGIDEEHLPRLFERFYRVDKSRSRDGGGTGLGLSIVKHIIEAHDQTINVRSTKEVGTTFAFTLKKV